ncbi:hypothetical protein Tco_0796977 [Tanacetum coccineum]
MLKSRNRTQFKIVVDILSEIIPTSLCVTDGGLPSVKWMKVNWFRPFSRNDTSRECLLQSTPNRGKGTLRLSCIAVPLGESTSGIERRLEFPECGRFFEESRSTREHKFFGPEYSILRKREMLWEGVFKNGLLVDKLVENIELFIWTYDVSRSEFLSGIMGSVISHVRFRARNRGGFRSNLTVVVYHGSGVAIVSFPSNMDLQVLSVAILIVEDVQFARFVRLRNLDSSCWTVGGVRDVDSVRMDRGAVTEALRKDVPPKNKDLEDAWKKHEKVDCLYVRTTERLLMKDFIDIVGSDLNMRQCRMDRSYSVDCASFRVKIRLGLGVEVLGFKSTWVSTFVHEAELYVDDIGGSLSLWNRIMMSYYDLGTDPLVEVYEREVKSFRKLVEDQKGYQRGYSKKVEDMLTVCTLESFSSPVVFRETHTGMYQPLPEVRREGKEKVEGDEQAALGFY